MKLLNWKRVCRSMEEKITKICDYQLDPYYIQEKLTDIEDGLRRNNIRIDRLYKGVEKWDMGKMWGKTAKSLPGHACFDPFETDVSFLFPLLFPFFSFLVGILWV